MGLCPGKLSKAEQQSRSEAEALNL